MNSISKWIRKETESIDWTCGMTATLDQLKVYAKKNVPRECVGNWDYASKRNRFLRNTFMQRKVGNACVVCGDDSDGIDRHHIIPLSKGGISIPENIIGVCRTCHEEIHGFKMERKL